MSPITSWLPLALALSMFVSVQEHGGVSYKLPSGWQATDQDGAKVFVPKALKDGEVVAVVLTPAVPSTNEPARKQFDTVVAEVNKELKVLAKGEVQAKTEGPNSVFVQAMDCQEAALGRHNRIYSMIIGPEKRLLAIVIIKPEAAADKYGEEIMSLVGSIRFTSSPPPTSKPSASARIPIGNTPDLSMGEPGWLPSGRGTKIPPSKIVNGQPQGIWWTTSYGRSDRANWFVFTPDGQHGHNPRLGGGDLWDAAGQKARPGANGVGPFSVSGGKMTRRYDGFIQTEPYRTGSDSAGPFFKFGVATFRPVNPPGKAIVGTWTFPGSRYIFRADGTYDFGQVTPELTWLPNRTQGTYVVEGYLVMLKRADGFTIIDSMGLADKDILLINGVFYKRS